MSWRAGARLFREIWPLIQRHVPEDGFRADLTRELIELFQRCDMDATDLRRAILTLGDDSHVAGHHNPYFATELARACNDWSVDRWLSQDPRLFSSIMVGSQLPEVAAEEVRRHAANPRMVQVMLVDNPFNRGFGHPVFHPIYAAAEGTGRPVAIHGGAGGCQVSQLTSKTLKFSVRGSLPSPAIPGGARSRNTRRPLVPSLGTAKLTFVRPAIAWFRITAPWSSSTCNCMGWPRVAGPGATSSWTRFGSAP